MNKTRFQDARIQAGGRYEHTRALAKVLGSRGLTEAQGASGAGARPQEALAGQALSTRTDPALLRVMDQAVAGAGEMARRLNLGPKERDAVVGPFSRVRDYLLDLAQCMAES